MDALRGRWSSDCRFAVPRAGAEVVGTVGTELLGRWCEPHRVYHGTTHLTEVLAAVDVLSTAVELPPQARSAALLGAWFHDAVYTVAVPGSGAAGSNEQRSAQVASDGLSRLGADARLTDRVATLVLDTASHEISGRVRDPARFVLHDADLWVLAAPVDRFDEYCRQVREEYAHVPAVEFARARSGILRPFLGREHVYRTGHARREWEPAARENLARELSRLAG